MGQYHEWKEEQHAGGGVYREHRMLLKGTPNPTKSEAAQLERWNLFLKGWKLAAKHKMCILIGDTNLDFCKWENPDARHAKMVQRTKEVMEDSGHIQLIKGPQGAGWVKLTAWLTRFGSIDHKEL